MKERPILFNGEMVRAILDGRKTQTRRVMKQQPAWYEPFDGYALMRPIAGYIAVGVNSTDIANFCPYGVAGNRLWVRETFAYLGGLSDRMPRQSRIAYRSERTEPSAFDGHWKPSIHMPRWASRITLEIINVRVERLQDIGKDGRKAKNVLAEGIAEAQIDHWRKWLHPDDAPAHTFGVLWDSINGNGAWDLNHWVWCLEFKTVAGGCSTSLK